MTNPERRVALDRGSHGPNTRDPGQLGVVAGEQADRAARTIATVQRWLRESADAPADPSAARLAGVLRDPAGLDFTIGFVDRVVRPEDLRVAGRELGRLARRIPRFLPWHLRALIALGGAVAPALPWPVVPIARGVLRRMVGHLVIDASDAKLGAAIARLRTGDATPGAAGAASVRLNVNLLGEAVLGQAEADRRLAGTRALLARDDVDYVSIKVSSIVSQLSMWAYDETVAQVVERLTPLYELAASAPTPKFINLDMEEYKDLDLTIEVFTRLLDQPQVHELEAGIVLQAYLPDALGALQRLTGWARARRAAGGASIKVRVVKGANLAMEHVDATVHGWPLATVGSKVEADANYKRVLDWALTPERADAVRIGVAGHNLFDVAHAWLLAIDRGVESRVEFEMLLGMATGQARAVRRDVGGLLLYTPVVHPREFDSGVAYLIRRLEENASPDNFMSAVFDLDDPAFFARERDRFLASLAALAEEGVAAPAPNRTQDRTAVATIAELSGTDFANEPDTDPALAANRAWGRAVLGRVPGSTLGADTIAAARVTTTDAVERLVADARAASVGWSARGAAERAALLHAAGETLAAYRGRLVEVMAAETGKIIAEGDVEVSEAIDFAHYYAGRAIELERVEGARFEPARLIVVAPPWNFPVAIPAGGVLAALASGASVVLKPAPQARRCAAVLVEALWAAGIPREVLTLVDVAEGELGRRLIAHPAVGRVILTGAYETAELFRSWRPDLPLVAETSGKNAIVVTPSADLDLAVADVVRSAFGHAGQKCSAASLVILVGSVARSERFRRQLVDSVRTLRVGPASDPLTHLGPVIEAPRGKLLRALTTLEPGQSWLVEPRPLPGPPAVPGPRPLPEPVDGAAAGGRLWTPGIRLGVAPGSEFHLTEYFGPVLGIMTAATLDEAIALQNAPAYGLTAGLHSLDPDEVAHWLDNVEAGNLYVNRGTTGAIVRRQPFGGWKRSTVGASAKAGGPNHLPTLGSWHAVPAAPADSFDAEGLGPLIARLLDDAAPELSFDDFDVVRRGARSDRAAWDAEFGVARDVSALGVERNVLRYRPFEGAVRVRLSERGMLRDLVRVLAAALLAGAAVEVSSGIRMSGALARLPVEIETDAAFRARVAREAPGRIRLIGGDARALAVALGGRADVAVYADEVTTAGRVELLPFLREQAISITSHRFGNPYPPFEALLPGDLVG
ncbi:bifunctional proline dehydrogenase/L-glutamate gamma-semialdehyde dehydrogenase [Galbitalea sp. SE-J8]|uniref:bifunctional proline dehydrogenase/L-glutamate gamma-semialdehyde dehydrogenase n=1 Tax=Galbitalea sp. SE-J8 TaxID=3054952 RepID=UPI00259CCACC|nr:bifunctional proline dehydrogenase/L-glutamate gamma-semialdehyde dehydrogenase [Galbitalea sp. SE-J8]MDM4763340.1 bifunctional proline dehydrogenase/L-glutamate gamma-semialdehyde dehydrogenase [Galbitalea sp. SE-J8]